jgi:hypothetical protein
MTSASTSTFQRAGTIRQRHGFRAAAQWLTSRSMETALHVELSQMLRLRLESLPPFSGFDPEIAFRFLTPAEVNRFAQDPRNQLAAEFPARAQSGHDVCLAALRGDRLASYSWYAFRSIEGRHHVGVSMSYSANTAYMYNAFTRPEYRGRRLYGIGITLALRELAERGVTQLITTVNCANFASLQSCRRIGFENIGRLCTFGGGPKRRAIVPRTAKRLGISFGRRARIVER